MKKNVFLLFLLVFLFSCSLSNSETKESTGLTLHDVSEFSISLPRDWVILTDSGNVLPTPKNGEIILAASSTEFKYGFSNNLLILGQNLSKPVTSLDFSLLNHVGSTKEYLEYLKLESKNFEFLDNDKSSLYIFEARYNTKTPKLKFLQVGKVCGSFKGYLLTVALSTDTKDVSRYEEMLRTFKCKNKQP